MRTITYVKIETTAGDMVGRRFVANVDPAIADEVARAVGDGFGHPAYQTTITIDVADTIDEVVAAAAAQPLHTTYAHAAARRGW